ncbi:MAG: hypothetical protein CMQ61_10400 [Gammaproteobacteria bacterium]|nr:hypothetical protein [Gammaproteobacteria bacterium]|tara:strand:+ start:264 stop:443 length:180 start_codon:yes stop_codon:yes gene_type:complete
MVQFAAAMLLAQQKQRYFRTSSCPVGAGRRSIELWPQPIFISMTEELKVSPAGSPTTCK